MGGIINIKTGLPFAPSWPRVRENHASPYISLGEGKVDGEAASPQTLGRSRGLVLGARGIACGGAKKLPYNAEVQYLESSGHQWVDLGITSASGMVISCTAMIVSGSAYGAVVGPNASSSSTSYGFVYHASLGRLYTWIGATGRKYWSAKAGTLYTLYESYDYVSCNGSKATTGDGTAAKYGLAMRLHTTTSSRIYACSVDATLDLVPVRVGNGATAEGCYYDRISGNLYRNSGTGTFGWAETDGTVVSPT